MFRYLLGQSRSRIVKRVLPGLALKQTRHYKKESYARNKS